MDIKFANNASTALAEELTSTATSLDVLPDTGLLFPILTQANDYFLVTIVHPTTGAMEICKVTATAGDAFTVVRAQEGTTAQSFPPNSIVENRFTAGSLEITLNDTTATHTREGRVRLATVEETREASLDTAVCLTPFDLRGLLMFPGMVVMFSGLINSNGNPIDGNTGEPNTDWHICDGTKGTPDLRGKFIIGVSPDIPQGSGGGMQELKPKVTISETVLTADSVKGLLAGEVHAGWEDAPFTSPWANGLFGLKDLGGSTDDGGSWHGGVHKHSITLGSGGSDDVDPAGHTHEATIIWEGDEDTESTTGNETVGKTYPPFYALAYIIKTS